MQTPYDAIIVTCAVNHVPPPLKKQLKIGGRLILPLGSTTYFQTLILITRESEERFRKKTLIDVRFVPMTGKAQKKAEGKESQPADKKEPQKIEFCGI